MCQSGGDVEADGADRDAGVVEVKGVGGRPRELTWLMGDRLDHTGPGQLAEAPVHRVLREELEPLSDLAGAGPGNEHTVVVLGVGQQVVQDGERLRPVLGAGT